MSITCVQFNNVYVLVLYTVAMIAPFPPMIRAMITTPYSVNISWVVSSIVFDQENYVVQYGTDRMMLLSSSDEIEGNNNTDTINDVFSVNITGLTPFTRYFYTIVATNSIGNSTTPVMTFITNQTGTYYE